MDLPLVADAVGEQLRAFELVAALSVDGRRIEELLGRSQKARLSVPGHLAVQSIVYNTLDIAVGFDLTSTRRQACGIGVPGPILAYRGIFNDQTKGVLQAARLAVTAAIEANNPDLVKGPIRAFWAEHPDYRPAHAGRCYQHGHAEHPYRSPADCQIAELQATLSIFLPSRTKREY